MFGYNANHDDKKAFQRQLDFGKTHAFDEISKEKGKEILCEDIEKIIYTVGEKQCLIKIF